MLVNKFFIFFEKVFDAITTFFLKRRFKKFGKNSIIRYGCIINHPEKIEIGENVFIGDHVWLNAGCYRADDRASLIIKDGTHISRFTHINAFYDVIIEEDVLIAENVYLGDADHENKENDTPIIKQGYKIKSPVLLKKGCFICKNVVISGGLEIGEYSIVGPNSFVIKSIPSRKIAIGNPTKIYNKINSYDD